jgi:thiosulfate reductase cytochrome b subunit
MAAIQQVLAALGGAEIAGFLHRVAAVVTFGYFAVHLTMLFRDVAIRKEKGYFWGWRSMTPRSSASAVSYLPALSARMAVS